MKFTVDRSKWARGDNGPAGGSSYLLDEYGKMCCLGFCMRQLGEPEQAIFLKPMPADLSKQISGFVDLRIDHDDAPPFFYNWWWVKEAAEINDNPFISDLEREVKLAELFAQNGHELEFYGE